MAPADVFSCVNLKQDPSSLQVSIGNPEKMEPITNVSQIPSNRWALICCLCKEKSGACIQVGEALCRGGGEKREEELLPTLLPSLLLS